MTECFSPLTWALAWRDSKSISAAGWAEQLRGLCRPRAHGDIDLLYPYEAWDAFDWLITDQQVGEIIAKRFADKRAIVLGGTIVELFLVRFDDRGAHTLFRDRVRDDWSADLLDYVGKIPVPALPHYAATRAVHGDIYG